MPGFAVRTHEHMLALPFAWSRSRMVFVNSMGALFHEDVSPYATRTRPRRAT